MMNSIKRQLVVVFLGLIVILLSVVFIINSSFLGQYYILHKKSDMMEMYQMLDRAITTGNLGEEQQQEEIQRQSDRTNIFLMVVDQEAELILCTERKKEVMFSQLFGYITRQKMGEVLDEEENYVVCRARDILNNGTMYLEMFGTLSNDDWFLLRSPLESIRDSAALANKFLAYVGTVTLVFGALFVWFFSKKITDPILELAVLSKRMANLDFDAKYTGGGKDEIGILGESFNTMSQKLERTVSELKSANHQLQKDIEQKEKIELMRTEFLGNVSHELKTPIALIQGYAEGLKEGIDEDPESREFYCDVIIDESNKMNQMVKNLLTLNQLEFGSEELEVTRFDVIRLIRGVIASCEILIQQAEASVDFIADESLFVWADEFKTEQVFRNYLTNAIHHVDYEKRIEIRVIPNGDIVRITVFNSGTPIPEEDIDKLWDKFYKVDKAHTREYGGNGIGLSIVKAIMESFHQQYGVCNYDNGVEFWFELDAKVR
ncbi:MAG: HAMP domain-containing protein [Ruminococcus sp.]|nr:HAMP domain-containing protein [Ruminococcus sp.]